MPGRRTLVSSLVVALPLLLVAFVALGSQAITPQTPAGQVRRAWELVRDSGSYHYTTDLTQTTLPSLTVTSGGQAAQVEQLYIDGSVDVQRHAMELRLWHGSGSAATGDDAVEIRIDNGQASGRGPNGTWEPLPGATDAFAPDGDPLAFLAGMQDVTPIAELGPGGTHGYRFDIAGQPLALYLRDRMQERLLSQGDLPPGLSLGVSESLSALRGDGEIWLGEDGLPVRLRVDLVRPPDERGQAVTAAIGTDFSAFVAPAGASSLLDRSVRSLARLLGLRDGVELGSVFGTLGFGVLFAALIVATRRRRPVQAIVTAVALTVMVSAPLFQAHAIRAFAAEQQARVAAQEHDRADADARRDARNALLTNTWDASAPPHPQSVVSVAGNLASSTTTSNANNKADNGDDIDKDGLSDWRETNTYKSKTKVGDTDGDGLGDGVEANQLGTDPIKTDTDGDKIPDNVEVAGFSFNGGRLYTNPLDPDTNTDGQLDNVECPQLVGSATAACQDTDSDGTPDIFDVDNDGDGVNDRIDLSPYRIERGYSAERPLALNIASVQRGYDVLLDLQLRPTDPKHLAYGLSVFDWPTGDNDGQIRRLSNTTFADVEGAGSPQAANGDTRLTPMLEVTLKGPQLPLPRATKATGSMPFANALAAGTLSMLQENGQSRFTLSYTTAPAANTTVAIYPGACPSSVAGPGGAPLATFSGPTASAPQKLLAVANGAHALVLTSGSSVACATLIDLPNGNDPDRMIDTEALRQYGITVRDADLSAAGDVVAYVPLTMVSDETGSQRQAFGARMLYRLDADNTNAAFASPVSMRLVWLVQLLNDDRSISTIQTYGDKFQLTGLSLREDRGLEVAVALEVPANDTNKRLDDNLLVVAEGLRTGFTSGRAKSNGVRDLTVQDLANRFAANQGDTNADKEKRWKIPADAVRVERFSLRNIDQLATLPGGQTRELLNKYFLSGTTALVDTPSLLFAREETYRQLNLQDADLVTSGGSIELSFTKATLSTVAAYNVRPFRYSQGSGWAPADLDNYRVTFGEYQKAAFLAKPPQPLTANDLIDPQLMRGLVATATANYLALTRGEQRLVQLGSTVIEAKEKIASDAQLATQVQERGAQVVGSIQSALEQAFAPSDPRTLKEKIIGKFLEKHDEAMGAIDTVSSGLDWIKKNKLLVVAGAVSAVVVVALFAKFAPELGSKIVGVVLDIASDLKSVYSAYSDVSELKATLASGDTLKIAKTNELQQASKKAAIVGLVLSIGLQTGLFVAQIMAGDISVNSLEFRAAFAAFLGKIIVDVLLFALSTIVPYGSLIVAVVTLIDSLTLAICKQFGASEQDQETKCGLTKVVARVLSLFISKQIDLVTNMGDDKRLAIVSVSPKLVDANKGFVVGSVVNYAVEVRNTLQLDKEFHPWFGVSADLDMFKLASFKYTLQPERVNSSVELGQTTNWIVDKDTVDNGVTRIHIHKNFKAEGSSPLQQAGINRPSALFLSEAFAIPVLECAGAGGSCDPTPRRETNNIDLGASLRWDVLPATLDEFLAPAPKEGGFSLAWGQSGDLTLPRMKDFDNDGLLSQVDGGADPNDNNNDSDGDGVLDAAELERGTNPRLTDSDSDGLSDGEELRIGTLPGRADSDNDGLTDGEEVAGWDLVAIDPVGGNVVRSRVTSSPRTADGDNDGLSDKEEKLYGFNPNLASVAPVLSYSAALAGNPAAFYRGYVRPGATLDYQANVRNDLASRYAQGLLSVSAPSTVGGVPAAKPFVLKPNDPENIAGTLTVAPNVPSGPLNIVQAASAQVVDWREASNYARLWLRLNELKAASGQTPLFADSSGDQPPATISCARPACPTAGEAGVFGNAARFNGSQSLVVDGVPLGDRSFTVAVWAKRDELTRFDTALSAGGLWFGFMSDNYFYCKMGGSSLSTPSSITDTDWHHWACTYDLNSRKRTLFRDGEQVAQDQAPITFASTSRKLTVGRDEDGSIGFVGLLDELQVFERVLSLEELKRLTLSSLALDLPLDPQSGSGFAARDSNQNKVTCAGSSCPSTTTDGIAGSATFANGQAVRVSGPSLDLSDGKFTQAAWVNPQSSIASLAKNNCPPEAPFQAEYFKTPTATGAAFATKCEPFPGYHDWGTGGPSELAGSSDDFAVRWTGRFNFSATQEHAFQMMGDDRIIIRVDGSEVARMGSALAEEYTVRTIIASGAHDVSIEFQEGKGGASAFIGWDLFEKAMAPQGVIGRNSGEADAYPSIQVINGNGLRVGFGGLKTPKCPFSASYFDNEDLSGTAKVKTCQNLPLDNNWDTGGPAGLGKTDNFSARYEGEFYFPETRKYSFVLRADDGYRIFVDDVLKADRWDLGIKDEQQSISLSAGWHKLRFEHREGSGTAQFTVRWLPGSWQSYDLNNVLQPGRWNHVAAVFDGDRYHVYVNGLLKGDSPSFGGARPPAGRELTIGRSSEQAAMYIREVRTDSGGLKGVYLTRDLDANRLVAEDPEDIESKLRDKAIYVGDAPPEGQSKDVGRWIFFNDTVRLNMVVVYDKFGGGALNYGVLFDKTFSATDTPICRPVNFNVFAKKSFIYKDYDGALRFGDSSGGQAFPCTLAVNSLPFNGKLDEVQVYRSALTAAEVETIFRAGGQLLQFDFDDAVGTGRGSTNRRSFISSATLGGVGAACVDTAACPDAGLSGRINLAARFDGADDALKLASAPSLESQPFTVAFWARRSAAGRAGIVLGQGSDGVRAGLRVGFTDDNRFMCGFSQSDLLSTSAAYTDLDWHHWACTYDPVTKKRQVYLDGAEVQSDTPGGPYVGKGAITIGASYTGQQFFGGMLDDLRVYRVALDAGQIGRLRGEAAPTSIFHLDELAAGSFANSGRAPGGSCTKDNDKLKDACPTAALPGRIGLAPRFDGSNDAVAIGSTNEQGLADSFTATAWVNAESLDGLRPILGNGRVVLALDGGVPVLTVGDRQVNADKPISPNRWYQLAFRYDNAAGRATLFINGYIVGSGSVSAVGPASALTIGRAANRTFAGMIDELTIYAGAQTDREVRAVYTLQSSYVEERLVSNLVVDNDLPSSLLQGGPRLYAPLRPVGVTIATNDPTSIVSSTLVTVSPNGGSSPTIQAAQCANAEAGAAFCLNFNPANYGGNGIYTLASKATDLVGNTEAPKSKLEIVADGVAPSVATSLQENTLLKPAGTVQDRPMLSLSGTASDPDVAAGVVGSGAASVDLSLTDAAGNSIGAPSVRATVSGNTWSAIYPIDVRGGGPYRLSATVRDKVENARTVVLLNALYIDAIGPKPSLAADSDRKIKLGPNDSLTGTFVEQPDLQQVHGIKRGEAQFVSLTPPMPELDYATGSIDAPKAYIDFPFNETARNGELVLRDIAGGRAITCQQSCPATKAFDAQRQGLVFTKYTPPLEFTDVIGEESSPPRDYTIAMRFNLYDTREAKWIELTHTGQDTAPILSLKAERREVAGSYARNFVGRVILKIGYSGEERTVDNLSLNDWSYLVVAISMSKKQVNFFLNNKLVATRQLLQLPLFSDNNIFTLAGNGSIDELQYFPRTYTLADVTAGSNGSASAAMEAGANGGVSTLVGGSTNWQPIALASSGAGVKQSTFTIGVPSDLEGTYRVGLRGYDMGDNSGNTVDMIWKGEVDTTAPRLAVKRSFTFDRTIFDITVADLNLNNDVASSVSFTACSSLAVTKRDTYTERSYVSQPGIPVRTVKMQLTCSVDGLQTGASTLTVTDTFGNKRTLQVNAAASSSLMARSDGLTVEGVVALDANAPAVTIATPTNNAVITDLSSPIPITGTLSALRSARALTVTVDGAPLYTNSWAQGAQTAGDWSATWSPTTTGRFSLVAQLEDWSGATAAVTQSVVVDLAAPVVTIESTPYTISETSNGVLMLTGVVTDDAEIGLLTINVAGPVTLNDVVAHVYPPSIENGLRVSHWIADLPLGTTPATGDVYTFTANATDAAAGTATDTASFPVDVMAPELAESAVTFDGQPATPGATFASATIQAAASFRISDAGGVAEVSYAWADDSDWVTDFITVTNPGSGPLSAAATLTVDANTDGRALYLYIQAYDNYNTFNSWWIGPFYQDLPALPDYTSLRQAEGANAGAPYRGWQESPCAVLSRDNRSARASEGTNPRLTQQLAATHDAEFLSLNWRGANWDLDGDLFIYLDTTPDDYDAATQTYTRTGTLLAYDPYESTMSSTLLLLPAHDPRTDGIPIGLPPGVPFVDELSADYAIHIIDSETAVLLVWDADTGAWSEVEQLPLPSDFAVEDEAWGYNYDEETAFTDLRIPLDSIDAVGRETLRLVAFASEDDALRIWATAPTDNPLNSALVSANAPYVDEPHQLILDNSLFINMRPGACAQPVGEFGAQVSSDPATLAYSRSDVDVRLLLPGEGLAPEDRAALFDRYDGAYQQWLENEYCPANPEAEACQPERPGLSDQDIVAQLAAVRTQSDRPLRPGEAFNLVVHYRNETANTYNGVRAVVEGQNVVWPNGCDVVDVGDIAAGTTGEAVISAVAGAQPVGEITIKLFNSFGAFDPNCGPVVPVGKPLDTLFVNYPLDNAPPAYVAIHSPHNVVAGAGVVVSGEATDASPVTTINLELGLVGGTTASVSCPAANDVGQWSCPLDLAAAVGKAPAAGDMVRMRARAGDVFGQAGDWTPWRELVVDTAAPTVTLAEELRGAAQPGGDAVLLDNVQAVLAGAVADDHDLDAVEVCIDDEECVPAELDVDPTTVTPDQEVIDDIPEAPVAIADASDQGVCAAPATRSFLVDEAFTVGDLQVALNVSHPYRSDLQATLTGPDGTSVTLLRNDTYDIGAADYDLLLTDASLQQLADDQDDHDAGAPYGDYRRAPDNPLRAFFGRAAQGTWTLSICDGWLGDVGSYNRASLIFEADRTPQAAQGTWSLRLTNLSDQDNVTHTARIVTVDRAGNRATAATVNYRIDTVVPQLSVAAVETTTVRGTAADGSAETVYVVVESPSGILSREDVTTDSDGSWSFTLLPREVGGYKVTAYAVDAASNRTVADPVVVAGYQIYLPIVGDGNSPSLSGSTTIWLPLVGGTP